MAELKSEVFHTKTNLAVTIRTLLPEEASKVQDFFRRIHQTSDYLVADMDELIEDLEFQKKWITEHLENSGSLILVAEAENKIVGLVSITARSKKRVAHTASLFTAVDKSWRNLGIGFLLLKQIQFWMNQQLQIVRLEMGVMSGNRPALALFKKVDFREEGIRLKAFKNANGSYSDDIRMYWLKSIENMF